MLLAITLALVQMLPALAQDGEVAVELDCDSNPETITISNATGVPLEVTGVTSLSVPESDPERVLDEFAFGAGGPPGEDGSTSIAIPGGPIFDDGRDEGAVIYTQFGHIEATCSAGGARVFRVPEDEPFIGKQPGRGTKKAFELTLHGEVPQRTNFAVFYTATGPTGEVILGARPFCGQRDEQVPDLQPCKGNGAVYTQELEFETHTRLQYDYIREDEITEGGEGGDEFVFGGRTETLNGDTTNRAYYDFRTQQGGTLINQQTPGMPDTGGGGTAGLRWSSAGVSMVLTMLAASGYAIVSRRRRELKPLDSATRYE